MKRLTAVLFLTLALWSANTAAQTFEDSIDRFTGKRGIKYVAKPKMTAPTVSTFVNVLDGEANSNLLITVFGFSRAGGSWKYLQCNQTHWLVDGNPFPTQGVIHRGKVIRGGVIEHLGQPLTLEQLDALAAATTIEFKICNDEFVMSKEDQEGLRQVAAAFAGAPNP